MREKSLLGEGGRLGVPIRAGVFDLGVSIKAGDRSSNYSGARAWESQLARVTSTKPSAPFKI